MRIMSKTNGRCWYCGVTLTRGTNRDRRAEACIDHVVPLSRGGTHSDSNLVPCCRSCNSSKSDRLTEEWRHQLGNLRKPIFYSDQKKYLLQLGIDVDALPDTVPDTAIAGGSVVFYFEELNGQGANS
jgi:5-methylcytosine-specific restriction endonuclease McrA